MTGLLHRLAARAAGTTVPVRSDARLPFGATGRGFDAAATILEPSSASAAHFSAPTAPIVPVPIVPPPIATAPIAPAPLEGSLVDTPMPAVTPRPLVAPALRADPHPWAVADADRDPRPSFPDAAPPSLKATVPPRMVDMPLDERRASPLRPVPQAESPGRSVLPHALDATSRSGAAQVVHDPPLLIPLAVSDRPRMPGAVATAAAPALAGLAQHGTSAEPSEVHIHIGRVEVTAVHETPAPRRRPVPATPPMSLEAYFARRGRG